MYKAQDTKLDRTVALKFLPHHLSAGAMEYVDGETLRKKIADGSVQKEEAVQYAIQIGEALQEAHSKGIVHRDIKADNVMVNSKNQIKVMDFGLAKLKGSHRLTRATSTVGTLAYMAPEQMQGSDVDVRAASRISVLFHSCVRERL